VTIFPDQSLDEAVHRMSLNSLRQLPVVSRADSTHLLGLLGRSDVFTAYSLQAASIDPIDELTDMAGIEAYGTGVLALTIGPESKLAGTALSQLQLPEECLIASVIRRGEALIPRGRTKLMANDRLLIIAQPGRYREIELALGGTRDAPTVQQRPR
jgi:Trk K+ transport system NAD-binding subunit